MIRYIKYLLYFLFVFYLSFYANKSALAEDNTAIIVIDAEFSLPNSTSAQAVALGAQLAVNDIEAMGLLKDRRLIIEHSDNRGVPAIGVDNVSKAAERSNVLAVMGGKFSPVYIEQRPVADRLGVVLLDPWGSADDITKMADGRNWAFRLSLTDQWAASSFINEANRRSAKRIGVIIPNTAWGRSNSSALKAASINNNIQIVSEAVYNWGEKSLLQQYQTMLEARAELVILVANENEGALFVREVANLSKEKRLPILAHWGITGGNFVELTNGLIENIDLSVIQTFSFYNPISDKAQSLIPRILEALHASDKADIKSSVGIVQAYDLVWLLALAAAKANSFERNAVREALENIEKYDGVLKSYKRPFTTENHNAPISDQIFFARYGYAKDPLPLY